MSVIHKTDENDNSEVEIEEGEEHQYEEESFEGKECAVCKDVPESIIYLACDHIICLVCAAKSILSTEDPEEIDFSQIVCQICQEQTVLSKEVQETLYQFLTNNQDDDEKEEQSQDESEDQNQNTSQDYEKHNEDSVKSYQQEQKEQSIIRNSDKSEIDKEDHSKKNEQLVLRKISTENPAQNENSEDDQRSDFENPESKKQKLDSIVNQENNTENGNQDDDEEDEERQSYQSSEVYLTFQCQNHPSDNYSYYSTAYKKLLCPQCLIDGKNQDQMRDIKPLKRCFPEILQNVQDMLNEVEVQKNLLLNKKKDFEIRQDNCKSQIYSQYKKFEIAVDEIIQQMGELKSSFLHEFDNKGRILIEQVSKEQSHFEDKIKFFQSIIQNITNIKQNSESPDEEILNYFFQQQESIYEQLEIQKQMDQQLKYEEKQVFQNFHNKIQSEQAEMYKRYLMDMRNKIDSELDKLGGLDRTLKHRQIPDNIKLNFVTQESNRLITEENGKSNKYPNFNSLKKASELPVDMNNKQKDFLNCLRTKKRTGSLDPKLYQFKKQSVGRTKYNFWDSSSKFNKDVDNNSRYQNNAFNKINLMQKQEIDRKFQLLDYKYKRENMFNSINTLNGFARKQNFLTQKPSNLNHFQVKKFNYIDRIKQKSNMRSLNTKNTSQISNKSTKHIILLLKYIA